MIAKQALVIFFELINFGVLIALMYYVWRRYGRSYMAKQFKVIQGYREGLHRTHTVLQQEKRLIKKQYMEENEEREYLKEQLFSWKDEIEKERHELEKEKELRQRMLKNRIERQIAQVEQHQLYSQLSQEAIQDARMELEQQYASKQAQEQFINDILQEMH